MNKEGLKKINILIIILVGTILVGAIGFWIGNMTTLNFTGSDRVVSMDEIAQFEKRYGVALSYGLEDNQDRDVEISIPSTTITLSKADYSNEIRALPPTTTKEQYLGLSDTYTIENYRSDYEKNVYTDNFFVDKEPTWNELVDKFGDFGTRFLSGEFDGERWVVGAIKESDINGDGQKEKIVYMSEDLDHSDWRILVIKNQKIIFSVKGGRESAPKLVPSEAGNGFYVKWINESKHYGKGYCCPTGYMITWFVFENNEFIPIYEQEVEKW
ncbi:MAG: hypothetical protein PHQ20_04845 [Candidatus Moranbacteria bacterium]|nr:hypothetical protein [Candidatus Moranbacteria bacterium]